MEPKNELLTNKKLTEVETNEAKKPTKRIRKKRNQPKKQKNRIRKKWFPNSHSSF